MHFECHIPISFFSSCSHLIGRKGDKGVGRVGCDSDPYSVFGECESPILRKVLGKISVEFYYTQKGMHKGCLWLLIIQYVFLGVHVAKLRLSAHPARVLVASPKAKLT